MSSISKELHELVERLLGDDVATGFFNILDSPEHWNYDYFLSLLPLLNSSNKRLAVLAPEFVAKGSRKDKTSKLPRHTLLAKNLLDAVITLPVQVAHHKNLPVTLILFNADKEEQTILFINAAQKFQTEQGKLMVQEAQMAKILGTYKRVRTEKHESNELSSPVCYGDQLVDNKPGVIIDQYAYLATLAEIARCHCSVSPADYVR